MNEESRLFYGVETTFPLADRAFLAVSIIVSVAILLCVMRLLKGPTLTDRVVALDLISALMMVVFMAFALLFGHEVYLSVSLIIAVVGFLATVSITRYLETRNSGDE